MFTRLFNRPYCTPHPYKMAPIGFLALLSAEVCMANKDIYQLTRPVGEREGCLSQILQERRTTRSFATRSLSQIQVAQLLWAGQGVTSPEG